MKASIRILVAAASLTALSAFAAGDTPEPMDIPDGNKLDLRHGMQIYKAKCASCHAAGKDGAPRLRDRNAWKNRSFQSISTLEQHAKKGFLGMPAKGQTAALSDDDIADAVYYMSSQIGERIEGDAAGKQRAK